MAPVQNHFTIIPNAPSAINGGVGGEDGSSLPFAAPMTTKQVKKAYQKKTRVPKLSKAEQRRQDLFEQDRIRREFEKEKNQARARLARDRKKEKEEKERAEKKKKGLPLVEVHPSQDTISRFLRGNSRRRESSIDANPNPNPKVLEPPPKSPVARNAEDSDTDSGTLSGGDGDEDRDEEPPPKKQRIETSPPCDPVPMKCSPDVAVEDLVQAASNDDADTVTNDAAQPQTEPVYAVDDMLEQELISQQLLSESTHAPSSPAKEDEDKAEKVKDNRVIAGGGVESEWMLPKLPEVTSSHASNHTFQPQVVVPSQPARPEKQPRQPIDPSPVPADVPTNKEPEKDMAPRAARRPLQELPVMDTQMRDNIAPLKPRPFPVKPTITPHKSTINSPKHMFRKPPAPGSAPRLSSRPQNATPMGPPPRPPKFKSPARPPGRVAGVSSIRPKFINKAPQNDHQGPGVAHLGQGSLNPPSSTQQFMISHLDDFFPSPSQEVRELYNEPVASSRAECSQAISISQDSTGMSSPSIRQILPSKAPIVLDASAQLRHTDSKSAAPNPGEQNVTHGTQASILATHGPCDVLATTGSVDIPFFSTQDLVLSQDWMDPKEDLDSSLEIQNCNGSVPVEEPNIGKVELPLVHETGDRSKSGFLNHNETNTEGYDQTKHLLSSPASQKMRGGRESVEEDNSPENISISGNVGPSLSKSRNKPKPQGLVAERSYVSLSKSEGSNGAISISGKSTKPAWQRTSTPTPQDKRSEPPPSKGGGASSHPPKPHNAPALPQWSPKPMFASTNRDFRSKYLIERNKTAVWEDSSARRKVQEAMDEFNREEEEAAEKLLMEYMCESQEMPAVAATSTTTADLVTTTTAEGRPSDSGRPPPPPSRSPDERPKKQTVNQLSSCPPPTTPTTAKRGTPTTQRSSNNKPDSMQKQQGSGGQRRPNSRPGGSYEEMLALLEQQQLKKSPQAKKADERSAVAPAPESAPAPPAASQETDYGDVELDDELYEFL